MAQFMMRRTLYAIVTLFVLSLTIFAVVRLPGDLIGRTGRARRRSRPRPRRVGARPLVAGAVSRLRQECLDRAAGKILQLRDAGQYALFPASAKLTGVGAGGDADFFFHRHT